MLMQIFDFLFPEDEGRSSHLLFTLHVYQYRIEKQENKAGLPGGNFFSLSQIGQK